MTAEICYLATKLSAVRRQCETTGAEISDLEAELNRMRESYAQEIAKAKKKLSSFPLIPSYSLIITDS